jgi:glutaredoxin
MRKASKKAVRNVVRNVVRKGSRNFVRKASKKGSKKAVRNVVRKASRNVVRKGSKKAVRKASRNIVRKASRNFVRKGSKKAVRKASRNIVRKDSKKVIKKAASHKKIMVVFGFTDYEKKFIVLTKIGCPYSIKAVEILKNEGYKFEEYNNAHPKINEKINKYNLQEHKTWPKISLIENGNNKYIGGCDNLIKYLNLNNFPNKTSSPNKTWLIFSKEGCDTCKKAKQYLDENDTEIVDAYVKDKLIPGVEKRMKSLLKEEEYNDIYPKIFKCEGNNYQYIGHFSQLQKYLEKKK